MVDDTGGGGGMTNGDVVGELYHVSCRFRTDSQWRGSSVALRHIAIIGESKMVSVIMGKVNTVGVGTYSDYPS